MSEWHGYEQRKGAHGSRPWWCIEGTFDRKHWMRSDGLTVSWEASDATLEAHDQTKPLPAPPPKCGQVWVDGPSGTQAMVCGVNPKGIGWFPDADGGANPPTWPPSGAVLVAGPHSPWAPDGGS